MRLSAACNFIRSSSLISWKPVGKLQKTIANCIERTGPGLHSGDVSTVKILPAAARSGRFFVFRSNVIQASIENAPKATPLCTTLSKDGYSITVEHLLSALEAKGVDNCCIEIESSNASALSVEVPILDGSASKWVESIDQVGMKVAIDCDGNSCEKLAPYLNEPVHLQRNDSFIAAFPCSEVNITYGIDYQQVEHMLNLGIIKGGSSETAIVCSTSRGWLNPPLHYQDEPCRHKMLDLIGDTSLLAEHGSQGLLVAHIIAYKGGHSLHTEFVRRLIGINSAATNGSDHEVKLGV